MEHVLYDERREKELQNKAVELGIEWVPTKKFGARVSAPRTAGSEFGSESGWSRNSSVVGEQEEEEVKIPAIFGSNVDDLKRPVISSKLWEIGLAETKSAPIGTAVDPGPIYNSQGNEKYFAYVGEWEKGFMKGNGTYQYRDGSTYVGQFQKNWPHGRGVAVYPGGERYEGEWIQTRTWMILHKLLHLKKVQS